MLALEAMKEEDWLGKMWKPKQIKRVTFIPQENKT